MEENKNNSKISFKNHGKKITVTRDNEDITFTDFMEMVEKLIFSAGFHKESLEDYIIEWGGELELNRNKQTNK